MNTKDLFNKGTTSKQLNEGLRKAFGKKLNLESFDLDQLSNARNKLRTQLSQMRSSSGFNENLENDTYHKAQWMLDAINAELAEREQHIADSEELAEGVMNQVDMLLQDIAAGEVDVYDILATPTSPVEQAASKILQDMYNEISVDYRLHPDDDFQEIEEKLVDQLVAKYTNNESQEEDMTRKVTEGEVQQASAIVTAKTMVDRISRWIEELSGMENDTMLQLGDSIRDEMGQEQAKSFISSAAPPLNSSLESLKAAREELSSAVRQLTGEESPMDMLGDEPGMDDEMGDEMGGEFGDDEIAPADPDAMVEPEDEFGAADAAAGGAEVAGRMKRESIDRGTNLMKILAG